MSVASGYTFQKVLLLATVATATAAAVPEPSLAAASWGGVKLLHLMAGAIGAGWTLSVMPALTLGKILSTGFMGITLAGLGTALLVEKWGTPPLSEPATLLVAAGLGCAGFYVIPGFVKVCERFGANPLGFIDWWRKGDPPPPPAPGGGP